MGRSFEERQGGEEHQRMGLPSTRHEQTTENRRTARRARGAVSSGGMLAARHRGSITGLACLACRRRATAPPCSPSRPCRGPRTARPLPRLAAPASTPGFISKNDNEPIRQKKKASPKSCNIQHVLGNLHGKTIRFPNRYACMYIRARQVGGWVGGRAVRDHHKNN